MTQSSGYICVRELDTAIILEVSRDSLQSLLIIVGIFPPIRLTMLPSVWRNVIMRPNRFSVSEYFSRFILEVEVEEDEVGGTCGTNGGEEERV
jgi:hypothetical protein